MPWVEPRTRRYRCCMHRRGLGSSRGFAWFLASSSRACTHLADLAVRPMRQRGRAFPQRLINFPARMTRAAMLNVLHAHNKFPQRWLFNMAHDGHKIICGRTHATRLFYQVILVATYRGNVKALVTVHHHQLAPPRRPILHIKADLGVTTNNPGDTLSR